MKLSTSVTNLLHIDLPIIGAPMFLVSYPDLVAAVSNAGGIGCFPALNYRTTEALKDGLAEIRAKTNKPIGVNLILHKEHNPRWQEQYELLLQEKVELIITSLGTPRTIAGEIKSTGARLFCDVTTMRHAEIVTKAGADALIAVAQGAGGHAGAISPFALIPYLKSLGLPVVAAGSIGTGGQMAAALALGADAVYIGTRLIATVEAQGSPEYKQMIVESAPEEIVYTDSVSGIPANWLKRSIEKRSAQETHGSLDDYKKWRDIWSAGHGIAQIDSIVPAGDVIRSMADQYAAAVEHLPRPL